MAAAETIAPALAPDAALPDGAAADGAPRRCASPTLCAHCGLPVPHARRAAIEAPAFCCTGCAAAWSLLNACGLDRYYALETRRAAAVQASGRTFEEFDHATFHALYVRARPGALAECDLVLGGVTCASCVWLIERTPRLVPGLVRAELDVVRRRVRVTWDPGATTLSAIARAFDHLGYRPHPFRGAAAEARWRAEERAMLVRIGVAGAIAINVMLAAIALYSGQFGGMDGAMTRYFRWVSLALTAPALAWPGAVFFRGAWRGLRARALAMDLPVAIALGAGFARGAVNTVLDHGPIYFDGVTALVFLLLAGRFVQQRAQRVAADAAELLHGLAPSTARVREAEGVREIPAEALLPGMEIEVRPGDTFPADGGVIEGQSHIDLALLTGESQPVPCGPGDPVWAGTLNRTAPLRVAVTACGETSRLGRMLADVERGARSRAPVVVLADRMAGGFVAIVLALAAVTFALGAHRHASRALDDAIALLVVTCPCALALATPLAIAAGVGRAARAGLLVRGGAALERLARPGVLVLDKTGTVTEGRTALEHWEGPAWVPAMVLAIEADSPHPIAEGFARAWPAVPPAPACDVRAVAGGGIEGVVDGRAIAIGSPAFVRSRIAPRGPARAFAPIDPALTPVWIAVDGAHVAVAGFGDRVRPEARACVDALRGRGWEVRLLSGDHPEVVRRVGASLGLDPDRCRGGATPEDKRRTIEEAARAGTVVMVGDGVNDAAAIACASVGVAVRGGAEASFAAADVYVASAGLAGLVALVRGSERLFGVIRRNIVFSLGYNAAGATLAMAGLIHPLMAALLMPASSLTVVLASWLSHTFDTPGAPRGPAPAAADAVRAVEGVA